MARFAILLRGINVGGKKKVSMAELRELLKKQGYADVSTLLQSGNVVLTSDETDPAAVAGQIERAIADEFSMTVRCLVRTGPEMRVVIEGNPLTARATNGSRMMALFLSEQPAAELLAANDPVTLAPLDVAVGERVVYQWCPDGVLEAPPVVGFLEKKLKVTVTGRNWNTVTKLSALLDA
jgi:uncharacterized protein (DUF1697 family)